MKNQLILLGTFTSLIFVWYVFPTEYERSMNEALKKQKEHPEIKEFDGDVEPVMPNETENNKTILGVDENKNGIRDDVDIWINRMGVDYNDRMAMRQFAKAMQDEMRVCSLGIRDEVSKVVTETMNSSYCLNALSDYLHDKRFAEDKIETIIISTKYRKNCLGFYDKNSYTAGGGMASDFHDNCKFKIDNLEEVKKKYHKFWGYLK